jgi:hypothetical protein
MLLESNAKENKRLKQEWRKSLNLPASTNKRRIQAAEAFREFSCLGLWALKPSPLNHFHPHMNTETVTLKMSAAAVKT